VRIWLAAASSGLSIVGASADMYTGFQVLEALSNGECR
jgi:hypothetical protein